MNGLSISAERLVCRVPIELAPTAEQAASRCMLFAQLAGQVAFPRLVDVEELPGFGFRVTVDESAGSRAALDATRQVPV